MCHVRACMRATTLLLTPRIYPVGGWRPCFVTEELSTVSAAAAAVVTFFQSSCTSDARHATSRCSLVDTLWIDTLSRPASYTHGGTLIVDASPMFGPGLVWQSEGTSQVSNTDPSCRCASAVFCLRRHSKCMTPL